MSPDLIFALGVAVLASSVILFGLSAWYWWTARKDYAAVKALRHSSRVAVVRMARGGMIEGWFKLVCACMWLALGAAVFLAPVPQRWQARAFILMLMGIYIVKVTVEIWTRYGVDLAINVELSEEQIAKALAITVQQQHSELMGAISENTEHTKAAGDAADKAYKEANHVNQKISDLNERILATEDSGAKVDAATSEAHLRNIEKNTEDTANAAKALTEVAKGKP